MMSYRGGIGGNAPTGPRTRGANRRRVSLDRVLSIAALLTSAALAAWEVAR